MLKYVTVSKNKRQRLGAREEEMAEAEPSQPQTQGFQFIEKKGDLFSCPPTDCLVHCVSVDLSMSKGIATLFKKKFGGVEELKRQEVGIGGVGVLKRSQRYVYYLVTKQKYFHKPTYDSLRSSVKAMVVHCQENQVKAISMPLIGCGLDKLEWPKVKTMLDEEFRNTNITVTVYSL